MKNIMKSVLVLVAAFSLAACNEPEAWTVLKKEQEQKVLAGEVSAEAFWEKAHEIAKEHSIPASEQEIIVEMIRDGKDLDAGKMTLDEYRHLHRLVMVQFAANKQAARRQAATAWGNAFSEMGQRAHERSLANTQSLRSVNCTTVNMGAGYSSTSCR